MKKLIEEIYKTDNKKKATLLYRRYDLLLMIDKLNKNDNWK